MPENKVKAKQGLRPEGLKSEKSKVKKAAVKAGGLSVPVYSLTGKESGMMELPKEVFGAKVNSDLLSQALRVYRANTKAHFGSTKTRGEVKGSTRKIRVQKGTGGARHGSVRAPIFVGGGIALGPKFRKVSLDLPKKMKRAALLSALSNKASEGEILGVAGLEKASGKTAEMRKLLKSLDKKSVLMVVEGKNENLFRAARNLPETEVLTSDQLNVLEAVRFQTLLLTKEAVEKLESRIKKQGPSEEKESKQ